MLYTGIDYHKKYSVVSTQDATGTRIREARIDENEPAAFAAYFQSLPEPSRVVVEACWNWGWLYDELGEIGPSEGVTPNLSGRLRVSWFFVALGFHVLFSLGCAEVRKTTNEYHVVVDNLELRLIAPSFPSYADKGPPTPGELAMQGRTIPREYPYIHLALDRQVGRVDLLNMRTGMKFTVIEYRGDTPFADLKQFKSWYSNQTKEAFLDLRLGNAFGLECLWSSSNRSSLSSSFRSGEKYFFLTKNGSALGLFFSAFDYGSPVPAEDHERIDALLEELKGGLSIKLRQP